MYFNRVAIMYAFYFELHSLDIISKRLYPFVLGKLIKNTFWDIKVIAYHYTSRISQTLRQQGYYHRSDNKGMPIQRYQGYHIGHIIRYIYQGCLKAWENKDILSIQMTRVSSVIS